MVLVNDGINSCSYDDEAGDTKNAQDESHRRNIYKGNEQRQQERKSKNASPDLKAEDNAELLLQLRQVTNKIGQQIKRIFFFVLNDLGGNEVIDRSAQWCVQHPQMAICLLAAGLVTFIPVLLFMAFALSTVVMTFTGFLILEGTILTVLTMIMFGLLGALGIVLLFFGLVGLATYLGLSHVYDMYGSTEIQKINLRHFVQRKNQNLNSVPVATTSSFQSVQEENGN